MQICSADSSLAVLWPRDSRTPLARLPASIRITEVYFDEQPLGQKTRRQSSEQIVIGAKDAA